MLNEEKILHMLEKIQSDVNLMKNDMDTVKAEVSEVKTEMETMKNFDSKQNSYTSKSEMLNAFKYLSNLLTDEEKDALGRYQSEEDARKAALYG